MKIHKITFNSTNVDEKWENFKSENSHPKDDIELKKIISQAIKLKGPKVDLNWIDTSDITGMYAIFQNSEFNGDISNWDVSNVESMYSMFYGSAFNGEISKWNVSRVKYMKYMFTKSKFNGDISKWDVSNVENMEGMFQDSEFNGDISKWNVGRVKNMMYMFEGSKFTGDISKWNVGKVEDMGSMFHRSEFNGDISKWNVGRVVDMRNMFANSKFNGDISNWSVSKVKDMEFMFEGSKFSGDISDWYTRDLKYMYSMFKGSPLEKNPPEWYDEDEGMNSRRITFNSKGTKYYGLFYVTESIHSQNGNLVALSANNLDEAIKESAEYIKKKTKRLANKVVSIVEDSVPYKEYVYVYPSSPSDHDNWHGSVVAQFSGDWEGSTGLMHINLKGIEDPNNWRKFTGKNSREVSSDINYYLVYVSDKFGNEQREYKVATDLDSYKLREDLFDALYPSQYDTDPKINVKSVTKGEYDKKAYPIWSVTYGKNFLNSRKSNSTHKFTGSLELTDDEKSEVNEVIKEFWDDSEPIESYIKVLNYFIKNWELMSKEIPANQFKTIEELMDWEGKNFGNHPSLIGNIENYIASELTDYVDQLPSQYNSRKSNSNFKDIHDKVVKAYEYLKRNLRDTKELDCIIDRYQTPDGDMRWCYVFLIPKSNTDEESQAAIEKVNSEGFWEAIKEDGKIYELYKDEYIVLISEDEFPISEKPMVHLMRNSRKSKNSRKITFNSKSDLDKLKKLSESNKWEDRVVVATNHNTPVDILKKLASDDQWNIRDGVAKNPNTPVDILKKLANDDIWLVRLRVAKNPDTPVDVLKKLTIDRDDDVRNAAEDNLKLPH